ncbi:MFS-1 domain containing protein [Pyrenophora tritici-repentis]|nr:MFS-1 domain-containing protein [Pyrenophora tritici-repentis]KAI1537597.1 MFS-1 domain containing protein [Pyrenophora tritici-repentis]PZC90417.1 MFS-1 domain containing protein [Pyrenophora tritici-repentis]PZD24217.1 MFS-1 domain containing protein [Pyrenophora tritici-repentis]
MSQKPETTTIDVSKPQVETTESIHKHVDNSGGKGKDKAAALLASNERIIVTEAENARVLKKIDLVILPILLSVYFLQSLDKTTLSYASVFGLIEDANLDPKSQQYSWLGSIVYIAQLVAQPLVAVLLVKLRMGKFMGVMVLTWGCILCGMAAAKDFTGLMVTRFLLGAFEAAIAPAFIAVVQMWYKRGEQTNRNAAWYAMLAKFFTEHERLVAVERLRMNQMGVASRVWKWDHVLEAFTDPKTWLWFCMLMAISIPSGGISAFGPLIIQSFGFGQFQTILFNMPFGLVQIVATIGGAWLATWLKKKSPVLILLCIPPIVGIIILMVVGRGPSHRGVLLFGYYLTSFYPGISPLIYSWSGQNTGGDTKRKVTTSILFVGASSGNIIGPQLFKPSEKPYYRKGLRANLALFVALIVLILLAMVWIKLMNRKHAATRESMGKSAVVIDTSMGASREGDAEEHENQTSGIGDKAFDDVTDIKNEDFIYVY